MMNWTKRLIASYDKLIKSMSDDEPKKKPVVYSNGKKRFVKVKRFTKKPIHRTYYDK